MLGPLNYSVASTCPYNSCISFQILDKSLVECRQFRSSVLRPRGKSVSSSGIPGKSVWLSILPIPFRLSVQCVTPFMCHFSLRDWRTYWLALWFSLSLYGTFTDTLKAFRWHSCMQWLSWNKNWIQLPSFSFIDGLSWSHVNMSYLHVSDCQIINTGPITIFRVRLGVKFFTYFWIALFRCCLFSIASEAKIFWVPTHVFKGPGSTRILYRMVLFV